MALQYVDPDIFNTVQVPTGRLEATLTVTNSTISGNAADSGGGIQSSDRPGGASLIARNSTIAFNTARAGGGGIGQHDGLENTNGVSLTNSLVAKNRAPTGPDVASDELGASAIFSLIGDGTGLGPLSANGGSTRTHALEPDSPAIDAATAPACPATDQRGVSRPQGAGCDIGSYEWKASAE